MQDNFTTGIAAAAVKPNLAVAVNSAVADGIKIPAAAQDIILWVTQTEATAAGQTVSVQISGFAKITAAGTIARGDFVKVDTAGKIVTTTTATDRCIGVAMNGAGSWEIATILLKDFLVGPIAS